MKIVSLGSKTFVFIIIFLFSSQAFFMTEKSFIPLAEQRYSIGKLWSWIQERNAEQSSFFVLTKSGRPLKLTDLKSFSIPLTKDLIDGSAPASIIEKIKMHDSQVLVRPTAEWAKENDSEVVLKSTPLLINFLDERGCFDKTNDDDKKNYGQLMLYFLVQASDGDFYPLFLVDPFPGKREELGGGNAVYPVGIVLNKFGYRH